MLVNSYCTPYVKPALSLLSCSPTPSKPKTVRCRSPTPSTVEKVLDAGSCSTDQEDEDGNCPVFVDREGNMVEVSHAAKRADAVLLLFVVQQSQHYSSSQLSCPPSHTGFM